MRRLHRRFWRHEPIERMYQDLALVAVGLIAAATVIPW